jgi:aminoglycoside phosphotransferase
VAWAYQGALTTWRLCSPERTTQFLKVRPAEERPSLLDEVARLRWARPHLPVPSVVAWGTEDGVDWLGLDALPGRDATAPELKARPEWLAPVLARGLRRFHQAPVEQCPFRLSVQDALATARARIDAGQAEHGDLHDEFAHLSLDEALATLEALAPQEEELVVCHGDYCFPNVLVDGRVSGYLDLGELAVADRWWDIAVDLEHRAGVGGAVHRQLRRGARPRSHDLLPAPLRPHLVTYRGGAGDDADRGRATFLVGPPPPAKTSLVRELLEVFPELYLFYENDRAGFRAPPAACGHGELQPAESTANGSKLSKLGSTLGFGRR